MDLQGDVIAAIAMALGASWASGLNLYATALILGGLGAMGVVDLPPDLLVLQDPTVLIAAAILYALEFFADKIPGVDTLNDTLHTFIRIPAGAFLAFGSVSGVAEPWQAVAALALGGVVTAGTHAAKTGSRALINTSPEPFSNWFASIFEDVIVVIGLLLALFQPAIFLIWMACFALFLVWVLPKIWRGLKSVWSALRGEARARSHSGDGRSLAAAFRVGPSVPDDKSGPQPPAPRL